MSIRISLTAVGTRFFAGAFILGGGFFISAWAGAAVGVSTTPGLATGGKNQLRLESEFKSVSDKDGAINGYESQTDLTVYRNWNETWGSLFGARLAQEDSAHRQPARFEEVSLGLSAIFSLGEARVRAEASYWSILPEELRRGDRHEGFFLADLRTNLWWSAKVKTRLRLRHREYVLNQSAPRAEIRQSKLEVSPGVVFHRVWLGIKNQVIHEALSHAQQNSFECGPFIRYDGRFFEPLAKIIYRPVHGSSSWRSADNWRREPVYSLEFELKF